MSYAETKLEEMRREEGVTQTLQARCKFSALAPRGYAVTERDSEGVLELLQHGGDTLCRWRREQGKGKDAILVLMECLPLLYSVQK